MNERLFTLINGSKIDIPWEGVTHREKEYASKVPDQNCRNPMAGLPSDIDAHPLPQPKFEYF